MAYIHVPRSRLNDIARLVYAEISSLGSFAAGQYVQHLIYEEIKKFLERDGHHHHESTNQISPAEYALLVHRVR